MSAPTDCPECKYAIEERAAILEFEAGVAAEIALLRAKKTTRCPAHPLQKKLWEER